MSMDEIFMFLFEVGHTICPLDPTVSLLCKGKFQLSSPGFPMLLMFSSLWECSNSCCHAYQLKKERKIKPYSLTSCSSSYSSIPLLHLQQINLSGYLYSSLLFLSFCPFLNPLPSDFISTIPLSNSLELTYHIYLLIVNGNNHYASPCLNNI